MNSKIKTYLTSKGIDLSVPFLVDKNHLEKIDEKFIYQNSYFEGKYIKYTMLGKKKELILRNCMIEATSLSNLDIKERIVFHNCIFDNVKISKCNFKNAIFYNCQFKNSIIINTILTQSYFVNCIDIENVDYIENKMDDVIVVGSNLNINELEQKQNTTENMTIQNEPLEIPHGNVAVLKEKNETIDSVNKNPRSIVKNEIYNKEELTEDVLYNKLFYKCHFLDCYTHDNMKLDATTDFKECTFLNMRLLFKDVDKTSFDDCVFENVSFKGNFIHVSFAGSKFNNLSFLDRTTFVSCQFDQTNAVDYFNDRNVELSHIELVKQVKNNNEIILNKLKELYETLKKEDNELQEELNQKNKVDEEGVLEYIDGLSGVEYLKLIAKTSTKVVNDKETL